ncbi:hypothetical protein AZI86_09695 [Bdellovibrio bacteriovorus]|uniref:Outer membrane protein beta-barrel domain-containing protein n=1 Tax=Bdellovibrio bacteriovorus TaxID=959 RepID=A0A150WSG5_BDEBC|nr:hypothetical protein [Bdellovibrio bacteriovorus]KYG67267.1 hypothetical protein AZI86_09695 [Bdellovibrio bacteriovorus]
MSETTAGSLKIRIGFLLAGLSLAASSYFFLSHSQESPNSRKSIATSRDHLPASAEENIAIAPTTVDEPANENLKPVIQNTLAETSPAKVSTVQIEMAPQVIPEKNPETLKTSKEEETKLLLPKIDFWAWAGLGVNYTSSSQTVEGFSELEFGRIKGPSTMLRAGFYVSDNAGLELGFKNTPGEAKSSESITVNDGEYNWLTMSAEALYRPVEKVKHSEWTWRLGLQQHQMPFLHVDGANEVSMVETSMTNLSLGFEYKKQLKKRLRLEWLMRYQYPIAASNNEGTNFKVSPTVSFDGSLGTAYQLSENTFIGVYWYGQYHDFDFKYQTPSTAEVSGRQSLFFTNFDLRLGMEF